MTERVEELNEREKFTCVVRWLNSLYTGYFYNKTFIPNEIYPCIDCPHEKKCPSIAKEGETRPTIAVPHNFKILERFTGIGTVIDGNFPYEDCRAVYLPFEKSEHF